MSASVETILLTGAEVSRWLDPVECREAIERAFAALGEGRAVAPQALGFESYGGGFHVKATLHHDERPLFVAKLNGNFPANPRTRGLPTIQGVLVVADARDGRPLCVMDSASVTATRTAAATAVAIRHLARAGADLAAIIGCGRQGAAHIESLLALRPFREIRLYDTDPGRAAALAARSGAPCRSSATLADAVRDAGVIVTCTPGADFVLGAADVAPGALVAGVGADYPHKREIHPSLMRSARVVVDDLDQCAAGGDLRHALEAGVLTTDDVHATLGAVVARVAPGREHDDDVVVFDSTGIALEDAAAAAVVYRTVAAARAGAIVAFGA